MRIIEKIVFSNSAPDNINTLWIDGKDIRIFGSNGWSTLDITENQRLYSLIQEETADREEADKQLLDKINEEISNREEEDEAIREALAVETQERQNADTQLQANIDQEVTDRTQAIEDLKSEMDTADTNLTSLINKETEDRITADEALDNTIETLEKKHDDFVATKGQPDGFAPLDSSGLVPSSHLPSYVDDVIEVYATYDKDEVGDLSNIQLYADPEHQTPITGEGGKIYVNITPDEPNYNFRWSGTQFSPIDTGGLILGEITGTAYDGAKGKHTTDVVNSIPSGMVSDLNRTPGSDSVDINVVKYIRGGDGTFTQDIPRTVNIPAATQSTAGVMSSADKQKLDGVETIINNNLYYQSDLSDDLATLEEHGGLPTGTTVADLKQMTLSEIFDEILFPTIYPTYQAPSASLRLTSTSTTPTIQEVGTTGSSVPTISSFTTGYNPGAINILSKKQANRGGALDEEQSFIYINGSISNTTFPTTIPDGTITYKYRAYYAQGPQPKDSKGNDYDTPLAAGYVDSSIVTVYGVYPYFTNKANITTFAKLPLTTSTTLSAQEFVAEGPNKHAFKLPAKYTLTKVEMLNTLSGKYEDFGTDRWDVTTENISVQGVDVEYKVYTRNDSGFNGISTFNITFSKS